MVFAVNLKVRVAFQEVGQKAHAAFERHELRAERQRLLFERRQNGAGRLEEALCEELVKFQAHVDLREVLLVLEGRARAETDAVAEIVVDKARHDRVEVDDAQRFARVAVEQDVIELRVIVRDAQREFPGGKQAGQRRSVLFVREDEVDFGLCQFGAAELVGF